MGIRACGALLAALCVAPVSGSAQERAPIYPEIIVATDDGFSRDTSLLDFIARLDRAADARVRVEGVGDLDDPSAVLPLLGAEVDVFVGRKVGNGAGQPRDLAFDPPRRLPAAAALDLVGRLFEGKVGDTAVNQRHGMGAIRRLLWDRTIGATPWLDGRICTASYGRLSDGAFDALVRSSGIPARDWLIAIGPPSSERSGGGLRYRGKPNQLVPRSHNVRRDGGWQSILTPDGATVHIRSWPWDSAYADYLNDHICFEKRDGAWRVGAIALRR